MMQDLAVHPAVLSALQQFLRQPAQAVLLAGHHGVGKGTLAENLAAQILGEDTGSLGRYPYLTKVIPDDKNTISIESIRALQKFLQLKTSGKRAIRRLAIIEHAGSLTIEAQNAFLKLLEEPPADTVMILTAANTRDLLPTVLSRLQVINVHSPEGQALRQFFEEQGKSRDAINQAFLLSGGLPGLMSAVINDASHPLLKNIATAKDILQKPVFERLCMAEPLSKQKNEALAVTEALIRISETMLEQASAKGDAARIKQWHRILKISNKAFQDLSGSGNAKLVLTSAFLQI